LKGECSKVGLGLNTKKTKTKVGLGLNTKKTKTLAFNIHDPEPLCITDGTKLEWQDDFKYLGSCVKDSVKDINTRKTIAWKTINGLNGLWKSNLNNT